MRFSQTTYNHLFSILFCLSLLALYSCTDDVAGVTEPPYEPVGSSAFVTLSITAPAQTRAANTPQGGEGGDGNLEDLTPAEDEVKNVTVFFYENSDLNTLAADGSKTILATEYYTELTKTDKDTYVTETREVALKDGTYRMLVVANAGLGLLDRNPQGSTIKNLCEAIQNGLPYKTENGMCTQFIMSSKEDTRIELKASGSSQSNPTKISGIELQRLAARIDFVPTLSGGKEKSYTLTGGVIAGYNFEYTVQPTAIKVVNRFNGGTYLLKRTAANITTAPTYLGKETADVNGRATNYVIDPWTSGKTVENYNGNGHNYKSFYDEPAEDPHTWNDADIIKTSGLTSYPNSTEQYYTLCYALENTTSAENQLAGYSTGVIIKATVIPSHIVGDGTTITNNEIKTFWYCNGIAYANERLARLASFINGHEVLHFKDGITYYPYFIRHSYNGSTGNAPMEFAIVRNNVYKLKINNISSLGYTDDRLDPDIPSRESYVKVGAAVVDWNELDKEEIIM